MFCFDASIPGAGIKASCSTHLQGHWNIAKNIAAEEGVAADFYKVSLLTRSAVSTVPLC